MVAEIALGRKTRFSAIGAFSALNKKYSFIGVLAALVPILILPYYSVIGGWVIKYFTVFITGQTKAAADDAYFSGFIGKTGEPIFWFALFVIITAVVVILGVEKGIETVSKFMMPVLVVLIVGISVYVLTIDGAWEGVKYYIMRYVPIFTENAVGCNGTAILFHVPCNGNHHHLWLLYEKDDKSGALCATGLKFLILRSHFLPD